VLHKGDTCNSAGLKDCGELDKRMDVQREEEEHRVVDMTGTELKEFRIWTMELPSD
jgi:hypothetical protein